MKEAEQLMNIGMERAKAIAQEQQNNMNLAMQLAQLISDKQEKEKDRVHESEENQKNREHDVTMEKLKHSNLKEIKSIDLINDLEKLVKEYDLQDRNAERASQYNLMVQKVLNEINKDYRGFEINAESRAKIDQITAEWNLKMGK